MLRRRAFDHVRVVLEADPALDPSTDYQAFLESWDATRLTFRHGSTPTWFTIRQLTSRQRDACYAREDNIARCHLAIRYGLVSVDGYEIVRPDGTTMVLEPPRRAAEDGAPIAEEWMDKAGFLLEEKMQLGLLILRLTEARPPT